MARERFDGPCVACGGTDKLGRYRKMMCHNCYRKQMRRERGLRRGGFPALVAQCSVCGHESNRIIRGMCHRCYHRIVIHGGNTVPRTKFTGPCILCGATEPGTGSKGRFYRKMCYSCYKRQTMERILHPPGIYKHGTKPELTREHWLRVLEFYDYRCAYCRTQCDAENITMDHVIPLSKGGRHHISNVVPSCRICNGKKGDGPPPYPVVTLSDDRGSDPAT